MKDFETIGRFIELRSKGWSFDKIARELNTSKQTLINWSRKCDLEISNLRAIRLEAIQEEYGLLKEQRMTTYGEGLKKVIEELRQRDPKDVSTDKLVTMIFKYQAVIQREIAEPVFREQKNSLDFDLNDGFKSVASWKP